MKKDLVANNQVVVFSDSKIRRVFHENVWWFSVIDVVEALTDSVNPRDYWHKMKVRVESEETNELSTICRQLKLNLKTAVEYPSSFFQDYFLTRLFSDC